MDIKYSTEIKVSVDGQVLGSIFESTLDNNYWIDPLAKKKTIWYYYIPGQSQKPILFNSLKSCKNAIFNGAVKLQLTKKEEAAFIRNNREW